MTGGRPDHTLRLALLTRSYPPDEGFGRQPAEPWWAR